MSRIAITGCLWLLLSLCHSFAQERDLMPWARDFREAAEIAARERKLVLLHFWADDCLPCRRLETNVFSREEVAGAVKTAFVPLKVHVEQSPELARRYQITRWPTDVVVTPTGLEVYRTVSPQEPIKYIAMLSDVARQSGSGLANNVQQSVTTATRGVENALVGAFQNQVGPYQPAASPPVHSAPPAAQATPSSVAVPSDVGAWPTMTNPYVLGGNRGDSASPVSPKQNDYAGEYGGGDYAPSTPATNDNAYAAQPTAPSPNLPPPPTFVQPNAPSQAAVNTATAKNELSGSEVIAPSRNTATTNTVVTNTAPQLPPLGMDGYCVVTLDQDSAWKKGDKRFGAIHRGKLYLFANAEHQQKFLGDPDRYSPALSGFDPVLFMEQGELIEGKREFGIKDGSQVYMFANLETRKKFEADPSRYMQSVQQAMLRADQSSKLR
jgi:YHS domain-containing protein/thioredoxin-related protein